MQGTQRVPGEPFGMNTSSPGRRILAGMAMAIAAAAFGPLMADVGEQSGNHPEPSGPQWAATDERAAAVAYLARYTGNEEGTKWEEHTASLWVWSRESRVVESGGPAGRIEGRILLITRHQTHAADGGTRTWRGRIGPGGTLRMTAGPGGTLDAVLQDDAGRECTVRATFAASPGRIKYASPSVTESVSDSPKMTASGSCLGLPVMTGESGRIWHRIERRTSADRPATRTPAEDEIVTLAGVRESGYAGDGGPARWATLGDVNDVAVAPGGTIYIAEGDRIRRIGTDGIVSTVVRRDCDWLESGPDPDATLCHATAIAVASGGDLIVADLETDIVRRFSADGRPLGALTRPGPAENPEQSRSGPVAVATDDNGRIFVAEAGANRVRRIDPDGSVHLVAGNGQCDGPAPAEVAAADAQLCRPSRVAVATDGTVYVTEPQQRRIRRIANGTVTIAFEGAPARSPLTSYGDEFWTAIALDGDDALFAANAAGRVYRIDAPGSATHVAGGPLNQPFDEMPATLAGLDGPSALAFDAAGFLLIAEGQAHTVRLADVDAAPRTSVVKPAADPQSRANLRSNECCARATVVSPNAVSSPAVPMDARVKAAARETTPAIPGRWPVATAIALVSLVAATAGGRARASRRARGGPPPPPSSSPSSP